jgi:hypothetical protein
MTEHAPGKSALFVTLIPEEPGPTQLRGESFVSITNYT